LVEETVSVEGISWRKALHVLGLGRESLTFFISEQLCKKKESIYS
jgi:hypothetical protein